MISMTMIMMIMREGIQESEIGISAIKEEVTGLYKMCKVLYM